jgi:chaperone modulatory protein CbpM
MKKNYTKAFTISEIELSLEELEHTLIIEREFIINLIEFDIIQPKGSNQNEWRFDSRCLTRSKLAIKYYREFEVNLPGIALLIDLHDELKSLKQQLLLNEKNK